MLVYLVGPITGKGYQEVMDNILDKAKKLNDMGYSVIHPMSGKHYLRTAKSFDAKMYDQFPASTKHAVFERDRWMVTQCDIIFADFSNAIDVSIGSCFELAWASLLGKQVISVLPKQNPHQHAFILEASDIVFPDLESALGYMDTFMKEML